MGGAKDSHSASVSICTSTLAIFALSLHSSLDVVAITGTTAAVTNG